MHKNNRIRKVAVAKRNRAWLLPLVFLAGYLFAWGTVLVDRQMLIEEQKALSQELKQTRQELQLREMVEGFGTDWQQIVIWNEETKVEPPEEEGK